MNQIQSSPDRIVAAIHTFCRIHGIDPESDPVLAFRCAMLGEVGHVLLSAHGCKTQSPIDTYLAQNPAH